MTANSCVSGLTYKVILPSSYSNMVNTLVTMLGNETEVSNATINKVTVRVGIAPRTDKH